LPSSVSRSLRIAGSSSVATCPTTATCIAVGNTSFELCDRLTVVVGMDRLLGAAHAAGELDRAIRDHPR